ncbi:hypothetical protein NM688_g5611 [Phlebia brevispora]|uniref:Uncharacterized protein n=1 Tax=Phlebia brevispora TaxID=194682 RepID=A0ACC1SSQ2_9APHY|nr:hypothetical protein NM688_g5611 [Phlebia brevispora]
MSLPTPPGTSHRGKENRRLTFSEPGSSRVAWSDSHKIYTVSETPVNRVTIPKSASKHAPSKSILKKTNWDELPPVEDEREITPEPADPLVDLDYLANPVARIIAVESTLRDLIEAYNVLAARIRACVTGSTDTDASWPLFQPLRKHHEALVDSMVRDLGRALEDPKATMKRAPEHNLENIDPELLASCLPSPKPSPNPKKKTGVSAEEVKYARDLCTVSQSVLKLLSAVFTMPSVYRVFTDDELGYLLTHVLAIPLANELPTPNARKTYALAIWLIQMQRLPADVLEPAKDRVAYAIRRGIEGELGKEGKKGSASDGLKAIHDLCMCYPDVFVPAFATLLSSILDNLLAPTLVLRTQACHALGGFAYALAVLPTSVLHTRVACTTAEFLTKAPLGTPSKKPESPTKDPMIIRTLRTTLGATDPKHVAQGPVWGLCVLASLIVMLGPIVYLEEKLTKCMKALFTLVGRHPKSSVRGLGCIVWRSMTWAYFRPRPVKLGATDDKDEDSVMWTEQDEKAYADRMKETWNVVESYVEVGAGVATIGATLAMPQASFEDSEEAVRRVLGTLKLMGRKGGIATSDASETLCRLVNRSQEVEWDWSKLMPVSVFSSFPGLLTADYKHLSQTVKPIADECHSIDEVRCLTREELTMDWVLSAVIDLWKDMLSPLKLAWGSDFPPEVLGTWTGILKAHVGALQDLYDSEGVLHLADYVADILNAILRSKKLDLGLKVDDTRDFAPTSPIRPDGEPFRGSVTPTGLPPLPPYRWRHALRLLLVRELWQVVQSLFPPQALVNCSKRVLTVLFEREADLVVETRLADEVRAQWALLCSEVAYFCEEDVLIGFWEAVRNRRCWSSNIRSCVWSNFTLIWRDEKDASWEASVILLSVPFLDGSSWDMTNNDLDRWDAFLRLTMDRALDFGVDAVTIVDRVAATISAQHCPTSLSSTRVADLLLSHLDFGEYRTAPSSLFEFVNDTLISTYPPEPRNKMPSIWLLRTLTRTMDTCPSELQEELLETVQGGVSPWIQDEYRVLTRKEYGLDVQPLYETIMANMMAFTPGVEVLDKFGPVVVSAFCGRTDKSEGLQDAFVEFWKAYADVVEPDYGWPAQILACLRTVGLSKEYTTLDNEEEDTEEKFLLPKRSSGRTPSRSTVTGRP